MRTGALEGIERLDGTLFVRVAGLTFDRLGWVGEGEKAGLGLGRLPNAGSVRHDQRRHLL